MSLHRRDLLRAIAALTGAAIVGLDSPFATAVITQPAIPDALAAQLVFFDEVAETILPRTDTPGAKDAQCGDFIVRFAQACYTPEQQAILLSGVATLDARMQAAHGIGFVQASAQQRVALLNVVDMQAKQQASDPRQPPHYFTLLKQLTLYGFFTSEPGATQVARYQPVPGPYQGCIPYQEGEGFWTW